MELILVLGKCHNLLHSPCKLVFVVENVNRLVEVKEKRQIRADNSK